jgi:hypothetical protein
MLKWFVRKKLTKFENEFGYDASYMRHVLDTDFGGFMAFARVQGMSRHRKDAPIDIYYAVKITGGVIADCGPCTQLVVTMALREGVPAATIAKIVRGDESVMTEPTRLGVRFARAVLARDSSADELREEIVKRYGQRALISLGFALVSSQMYPTLKYALGYGHACQRVTVEDQTIVPKLATA